jgi:hypothetical protein
LQVISHYLSNQYFLVTTDYVTKWVEAITLRTNITINTPKFLYGHILTQFGCPFNIIIDQDTHFINDVIDYLIDHFILKHTSSIVYYLQGNKQAKFTNKVFRTLFTKLVNENWSDWDEHMSTILFSYKTAFKVGTSHTPFQLVYKLHPLLFMKNLLPSKLGQIHDPHLFLFELINF